MQISTVLRFNSVLTLCVIIISCMQLLGQTWNPDPNTGDTNWHNAANWSTAAVPGPTSNVLIPNSTMYPIISVPASARSININNANTSLTVNSTLVINNSNGVGITNSGSLILNVDGIITIDNTGSHGILMPSGSSIDNSGEINIGTVGGADNIIGSGIRSEGVINNMTGSKIEIKEVTASGIAVLIGASLTNDGLIDIEETNTRGIISRGLLTNNSNATIQVNNTVDVGYYNDSVGGNAEVDNSGTINIDHTDMHGMYNGTSAEVNNSGIINIGTIGSADNINGDGVFSEGIIHNMSGGQLTIKEATVSGIQLLPTATLTNDGMIDIDEVSSDGILSSGLLTNNTAASLRIGTTGGVKNIGNDGICISATLLNEGHITIKEVTGDGLDMFTGATLTNDGMIDIDEVDRNGIRSRGSITNNSGASLRIGTSGAVKNIGNTGINLSTNATLINGGHITIKEVTGDGLGISSSGTLTNDGTINVYEVADNGINSSGTLTNNTGASIKIGTTGGVKNIGRDGIRISFNSSLINDGMIDVDEVDRVGILSYGLLTNNTGASLRIGTTGGVKNIGVIGINLSSSATLINGGLITIKEVNGRGILLESGGSLTNNACAVIELYTSIRNISNNPMALMNDGYIELNTSETHVPGIFHNNGLINDIQGTFPTDGINFTNSNYVIAPTNSTDCDFSVITDAFVSGGNNPYAVACIYSDAAATMVAGSYDVTTNIFMPNIPLMPNSSYTYYVKLSDSNGICSDVIVEWPVTTSSDIIIFDGGGDGIDWHDPDNWDQDIVPTFCHHVIIPPSYTVEVKNNSITAEGKTLKVSALAGLESLPGALVDIQN